MSVNLSENVFSGSTRNLKSTKSSSEFDIISMWSSWWLMRVANSPARSSSSSCSCYWLSPSSSHGNHRKRVNRTVIISRAALWSYFGERTKELQVEDKEIYCSPFIHLSYHRIFLMMFSFRLLLFLTHSPFHFHFSTELTRAPVSGLQTRVQETGI